MAGSFAMDISRFAAKAKGNTELVIRKISMEAFKRVILKTPVDTGRARANWSCTVGSMSNYSTSDTDKSGGATISAASSVVDSWSCKGSVFLTNNVEYILPLEYGHSKQFPNGMVRITAAEMLFWSRGIRL